MKFNEHLHGVNTHIPPALQGNHQVLHGVGDGSWHPISQFAMYSGWQKELIFLKKEKSVLDLAQEIWVHNFHLQKKISGGGKIK